MLSVVEAVAAAVVVVEVPMAQLGERFVVHAAPSWFSGFLSYLAEHAGLGVAAFGVGLGSETSEGLAEKSSIDDVAAVGADVVADGAHTREHSETALGGMAVEDRHSTSGGLVAFAGLARHTFCVDRVPKETRLMLESWIEAYGNLRWVGMVACQFGRLP